jgi:hypothetical protein
MRWAEGKGERRREEDGDEAEVSDGDEKGCRSDT